MRSPLLFAALLTACALPDDDGLPDLVDSRAGASSCGYFEADCDGTTVHDYVPADAAYVVELCRVTGYEAVPDPTAPGTWTQVRLAECTPWSGVDVTHDGATLYARCRRADSARYLAVSWSTCG